MKVTVEIPNPLKPKEWRQVTVTVMVSRKGNNYFKLLGKLYVFKAFNPRTPVLTLNDAGKWVVCGRIDGGGNIFLGGKNEMSSFEYSRTTVGIQEAARLWESYRQDLGLWRQKTP